MESVLSPLVFCLRMGSVSAVRCAIIYLHGLDRSYINVSIIVVLKRA